MVTFGQTGLNDQGCPNILGKWYGSIVLDPRKFFKMVWGWEDHHLVDSDGHFGLILAPKMIKMTIFGRN